jgi:hypothetical protein
MKDKSFLEKVEVYLGKIFHEEDKVNGGYKISLLKTVIVLAIIILSN